MDVIKGYTAALFIGANTAAACIPLFAMGLLRLLTWGSGHHTLSRWMDGIIDYWVSSNRLLMAALGLCKVELKLPTNAQLSRDEWYMVISNHQTWTDILLLQTSLRPHLPPIKFFTKQQLIWLPFLGLAMWLLGFPYVRRASPEQIKRQPELKDRDQKATLASCEDFKRHPTAVLNFLEGTRFTEAKHALQPARFKRLLNPKIGGMAYVLQGMGTALSGVLDVTIQYPDNQPPSFWDFLCGRCPSASLNVQLHSISAHISDGLDSNNKQPLANWVDNLWQTKDNQLAKQVNLKR
jgi:1-acyl-sn-glycerol-3-phosphate acyltransferase